MPTLASRALRSSTPALTRACLLALSVLAGVAVSCAPRPPAQTPPPAVVPPPEPPAPPQVEPAPGERERAEAEAALGEAHRLAQLGDEPNLRLALERLKGARELWERAGDREGPTRTLIEMAAIQARLASLLRLRGDLRAAQVSYRRAFEIDRDLGRRRNALGSLLELCAVQRDLGDDEAARGCYAQAVQESQALGDPAQEGESLAQLAEVALRQNRAKDALALLDRLAVVLPALPEERRPELRMRATLDSGIAKRNAGRPKEGLVDLQSALDLLGALGQGDGSSGALARTQIQIGVTRQRLGDLEGASLAFRLAGELAERGGLGGERRRSLFGLATVAFTRKNLEEARARIDEVLALDATQGELAPWERSLSPLDAGRHAFYELDVELLMRLHFEQPAAGFDELAFRAAGAARAVFGRSEPETVAGIEGRLSEGEAILHYFVGQERSYLFVVTRAGLRSFEVPIRARELAARVQRLRSTLGQPQATPRPFLMDAVPLFEVLLGPAEKYLTGKRRLIVSAEGPLLTLPFEVLPTDARASRGRGFADLPYLLLERAVSYRPTPGPPAAPRASGSSDEAEPGKTFLAFAAPLPEGLAPPPARYREEVEEIAGRYPKEAVEVYLGSEATARRAAGNPLFAGARRLHFAVPALLDSAQPERSALALTPADPSDDGLVEAAEIAGLHLSAELVVLPLCRTVRGREVGGEGGVALARAFRHAGAREVLLGLWTVPEAAVSSLLPKLYELLDAGEPPAEALRAAKLSLLQSGAADPMFWAPFLLID